MLINEQTLDLVFKGFKTKYTNAFMRAEPQWNKIAMQSPSTGSEETYGWIGEFPQLREWIGSRHVKGLEAHSFQIINQDFESTVSVKRNHIRDDKLGVFAPTFSEMGYMARTHPEEIIFGLLKSGFEKLCYDGQNFFDTDHTVTDINGELTSVSNMQEGTGPGWYLLDTSREIRPIIWQEREGYQFESMTQASDHNVFMNNEYIYGVRARVNAGFGLWQMGFGSKAILDSTNYAAARAAMMNFRSDGGRVLGVKPTLLVVPPDLEEQALHVINTEFSNGGGTNPWRGTAELLVTPYLAA